MNKSFVFEDIMQKTNQGNNIPVIDKNGVSVHRLNIFEDICLRNKDNLNTIALEINNTKMTYYEFFMEVEKYMQSFESLGLKCNDVISLCLPVGVEFICAYFASTTMGIVCNATNVMFLAKDGVKAYTEERCSDVLICSDQYYKLLKSVNAFEQCNLNKIIITSDSSYAHMLSEKEKTEIPDLGIKNVDFLTFEDFINSGKNNKKFKIVKYDESRISTFTYTSGTTGKSKCIAHSDLAPLFLIASHDNIKRPDEKAGDRSLLTIPLQHPTGLFYSMVLQLAMGKTLVLEPRYDKSIFYSDIKNLNINHAVQAKPFYAQLIQDRNLGKLKPGDFINFKHPYSGGEGIPKAVCNDINDTLHYAGCENDLTIGYGRSEEGSIVVGAYNILGRCNTVGAPIPGVDVRLVDPITKEVIPSIEGAVGEIQISTPVMPINNCYLGKYNTMGKSDNSIVDEKGIRWSQPNDIATVIKCKDGNLSYLTLGRTSNSVIRNDRIIYLFDIKEKLNEICGIQECEVIKISSSTDEDYITAHIVLNENYKEQKNIILKQIFKLFTDIDGVKFYESFGINATSGKCDIEAMSSDRNNYLYLKDDEICNVSFEENEHIKCKKLI